MIWKFWKITIFKAGKANRRFVLNVFGKKKKLKWIWNLKNWLKFWEILVPPTIDDEPQFVEVKQGDHAEISCDATGFPEPEISFLNSAGEPVPNGKFKFIIKLKIGLKNFKFIIKFIIKLRIG